MTYHGTSCKGHIYSLQLQPSVMAEKELQHKATKAKPPGFTLHIEVIAILSNTLAALALQGSGSQRTVSSRSLQNR